MIIQIATDGSCWPNPGPGGWAALFRAGERTKALYGWEGYATNSRMELMAAIKALEHLKRPCEVQLTIDSEYVMKGITLWINRWKQNGYKTAAFKDKPVTDVKNKDLWVRLDAARSIHTVNWVWTKGHANNVDNNLCDQLATKARKERKEGYIDLSNPKTLTTPTTDELIVNRMISFED